VLCEKCKQPYAPDQGELAEAGYQEVQIDQIEELFRPVGCEYCASTGYRGRFGLYEVMPMSEEIERLTVERASSEAIRTVALEQGMIELRADGLLKAAKGLTSIEEIARVVK